MNEDLIYENYKEPLKAIPKSEGYGFYGTVATSIDGNLVQCHICGNMFPSVSHHLRKHQIKAREYKEQFQLAITTALVGEATREKLQNKVYAESKKYIGLPEHLQEYNRKVQSGEIQHRTSGNGWSLERRNKEGLCPDQVLLKITELADKLGHTPSYDEFKLHYKTRYIHSIEYQHGSYLNAVKALKLTSAKELKEPSSEKLLEDLRKFQKVHGRVPTKSDFNRGLLYSRTLYWSRFGSLNNARIEAGLNAVVSMGFGRIKELTPDEYRAYREGKSSSKPKRAKKQDAVV